ncbi:unnamed protein product [Rhizoctonia solani]|uniref:Uncharacterized protein n=1 Tax=Rhizoctonia solani TaxID=456999 RepID=A0A8H2X0F5_9AGAM|nr:unnamed protein product [Rhizoctonia solani]
MGFIAQTFGNTFRTSNAHSAQQLSPTTRKLRPKSKLSKDITRSAVRGSTLTADPSTVDGAVSHKKRRHASPDGGYMLPYSSVAPDAGRPSCSSSVGSDEPLINSSKGKGKSTGGTAYEQNQNQSPYNNAAWPSARPRPRLEARPPTTNLLDAYERSELVRRSRKLESILGETPRLLDAADEYDTAEALNKLEGRQSSRANSSQSRPASSPVGRPNYRRSLTLDNISSGSPQSSSRPGSSPRHSFRLNDENSSTTPRSPYQRSGSGPRFSRTSSAARHPPVLRLSATPTGDINHPYLGRRHSSDLSVRRGISLSSVDMNVACESGSDISAPKRPSFDTSSLGSSTMPTFARPRSPSSLLDTASLSSKISLSDSMAGVSMGPPGRSTLIDRSLPPSPTTPLTPVLTQAEDARRKMRKLARHLGESVPADLVLGISGARPARHDYLSEEGPSQFLQVPSSGAGYTKPKHNTGTQAPFCLGKPPLGHRKTQSVWKGTKEEKSTSSRRIVRRASSAEQLRIDTPTQPQLTEAEKARNVHRAMKMLQLFGAPPPHELYTNIKSRSLDLPPDSATSTSQSSPVNRRTSVNSFRDLAYILDHDNPNSLLALIDDTMPNADAKVNSGPCADQGIPPSQGPGNEEESFQARRARANKLAKFFGVSYRDLFDAVCAEDAPATDTNAAAGPSSHPALKYLPEPPHESGVVTNNGSKWVEPKSVEEVLDRLREMKAPR